MNQVLISIRPKKAAFDPLASQVRSDLIDAGQKPAEAAVSTERLFKLEGNISEENAQRIAETLLVDPVVETFAIESANPKNAKAKGAVVVDIWPKPGVTDPVAETVLKGLRDMGLPAQITASTATRYIFSKVKDSKLIEGLAKRSLANELIHDIHVRKN